MDPSDEGPSLPPVVLPSAAELLTAAERSVLLSDLRQYVAGLDGKTAPGLTVIPRWAEACGLVEVLNGTHVPVEKNAKLLEQPLELWARAFEAVGQVASGLTVEGGDPPFAFGLVFPELVKATQTTLYTSGGEPVPRVLLYTLADKISAAQEFAGDPEPRWRQGLVTTLDLLERLGAVEHVAADPAKLAKIAKVTGIPEPDPTQVGFTPIALWAMNRMLREGGADAPVVGELAGADLGTLCAHLAMGTPKAALDELSAWVAHRSPATAADEAAALLRKTGSPVDRLFALIALGEAGEPGLAAAAAVRSEGGIAGAVAALWLFERGAIQAGTATGEEVANGTTDHLSALHELGGLLDKLRELDDPAGAIGAIGAIAAADHPDQLALLDVIAEEHPDPKVAKLARKARLKLRR